MTRPPGHRPYSDLLKPGISHREPFSFDEDTQKVELLNRSIGCRRIFIERHFLDFSSSK